MIFQVLLVLSLKFPFLLLMSNLQCVPQIRPLLPNPQPMWGVKTLRPRRKWTLSSFYPCPTAGLLFTSFQIFMVRINCKSKGRFYIASIQAKFLGPVPAHYWAVQKSTKLQMNFVNQRVYMLAIFFCSIVNLLIYAVGFLNLHFFWHELVLNSTGINNWA